MRKDKTGDTAQIQTRSEDTTATPSGIRGAGSEYLRKQDQGQEDQDPEIRIVQIVKQTLSIICENCPFSNEPIVS